MNSNTAQKHKEEGTNIIFLLTKLISELNSFSFGYVFCGKKKKDFYIMIGRHSELIRRVCDYNTLLNTDIAIGLSQNVDQIYPLKILDYQRIQIQDLMTQAFTILSGKQMELRYKRTLEYSMIALLVSLFSLVLNSISK